jgi:hypothetical protein
MSTPTDESTNMPTPIDNDSSNDPKHQEPKSSIKLTCDFNFSFKSIQPFLNALASLTAGVVIGAGSSGNLPLQNLFKWLGSTPLAPQQQPSLLQEMQKPENR